MSSANKRNTDIYGKKKGHSLEGHEVNKQTRSYCRLQEGALTP